MTVVGSFAEVRSAAPSGAIVGLVPTMGYLHEGHLSLIEQARASSDHVVMSLYVNPLQFNESSDLEAYPRNLERDVSLAADAGVDLVFAPDNAEMYPLEPLTRVVVSGLADEMEGAHRPGHFEGVATVVAKLFAGIQPDKAFFGRKDAQQLAIVSRMAQDLSFPVEIVGCPIVRHRSGLAMSSRNSRLGPEDLGPALALSRGLMRVADAVERGERSGATLEDIAMTHLEDEIGVEPEYATLAAQATMQRIERLDEPAVLAVAAWVAGVRLIDNVHVDFAGDAVAVDRGIRLGRPSVMFAEQGGF